MSIDLLSVIVRHERRLRLVFSNTLAVGAFTTGLYTITNLDTTALSPSVVAAMIVPGSPTVVELALSNELSVGSSYRVNAPSVPATDLSVTGGGTQELFSYGKAQSKEKIEPAVRDRERLLFQCDLIWNGANYEEDANGDLARIEGRANVTKALWHAISTNGLPWDPSWGVDGREYVDSPQSINVPLRGAVASQVARDPRVQEVKTTVEIRDTTTFIDVTPTLVGGFAGERVSVTVPHDQ